MKQFAVMANTRFVGISNCLLVLLLAPSITRGADAEIADVALVPESWHRQPVLVIPPARPAAPTKDGHLRGDEWFYAARVASLIDLESWDLPPYPMTVYMCYDNAAVYVGLNIGRDPMTPTPKATFEPGPHEHIWWKDDNFELVVEPGDPAQLDFGYAFAGNSIGGWADLRYEMKSGGSSQAWKGGWQYMATRAGRESWHAELRIPFDQFEGVTPPKPGDTWQMALMVQQITPRKRMIDWTHMWSFGQGSYRSPNKTTIIFGREDDPIFRPHGIGTLTATDKWKKRRETPMGLRMVTYHKGSKPIDMRCRADLFRAPDLAEPGMLSFYDLWDRLIEVQRTGEYVIDPKDPTQTQRTAEDLRRDLNRRYQHVRTLVGDRQVKPISGDIKGTYFGFEVPQQVGDYVLGYTFTDAETGRVLAAHVVPYKVLPAFKLTLTPYFLAYGRIRVDARLAEREDQPAHIVLTLKVDDSTIDEAAIDLSQRPAGVHSAYMDTTAWPADATGVVEARLLDAEGTLLETTSARLHRPPTPHWWDRRRGMSTIVPDPFESVRSETNNSASVWSRRVVFGDNGLPASITARGDELLARPISLSLDLADKLQRVEATQRDAVFVSTGENDALSMRTRAQLHYDGTIRFDIDLTPKRQTQLDHLVLDIPLREQYAKLFTHNSTGTAFATSKTAGLGGAIRRWFLAYSDGAMPFTFAFFLGGYDRGVQWFAPSDRGWSNANENRKIALAREDGAVTLRIRFIDQPTTVSEPLHLNFGLAITPTKPIDPAHTVEKIYYGKPEKLSQTDWDAWDETLAMVKHRGGDLITSYLDTRAHFAQPYIYNNENRAFLRQFVQRVHRHGLMYRPYCGFGVHTNIPQFATFGMEMLKQPLRNAGWGCYWHIPNATFCDWWLGGVATLVDEIDIDGIYLDGTAYPELASNELDGYGWTDASGNAHGTYPVWELRDFMERLYVMMHHEVRDSGLVDLHDGREPLYFINTFADSAIAGEGHLHAGSTILDVYEPDEFAAYYATHLHGSDRRCIWYNWMKLPMTRNEMWALYLLHDVGMPVGGGVVKYYGTLAGYARESRPWVRLRKLRRHYADCDVIHYWDGDPLVESGPPALLSTAWVDRVRQRAMVVVSNLTTQPWNGEIRIDVDRLGVPVEASMVDAMFNRRLTSPLRLEIEPQRYRVLLLNDRLPHDEKPRFDGTESTMVFAE